MGLGMTIVYIQEPGGGVADWANAFMSLHGKPCASLSNKIQRSKFGIFLYLVALKRGHSHLVQCRGGVADWANAFMSLHGKPCASLSNKIQRSKFGIFLYLVALKRGHSHLVQCRGGKGLHCLLLVTPLHMYHSNAVQNVHPNTRRSTSQEAFRMVLL